MEHKKKKREMLENSRKYFCHPFTFFLWMDSDPSTGAQLPQGLWRFCLQSRLEIILLSVQAKMI